MSAESGTFELGHYRTKQDIGLIEMLRLKHIQHVAERLKLGRFVSEGTTGGSELEVSEHMGCRSVLLKYGRPIISAEVQIVYDDGSYIDELPFVAAWVDDGEGRRTFSLARDPRDNTMKWPEVSGVIRVAGYIQRSMQVVRMRGLEPPRAQGSLAPEASASTIPPHPQN